MTYRYLFLFLHTATSMFLARKSRTLATGSGTEQRRWIVASIGTLMSKSFRMSTEVYQAMLARGFHGEIQSYEDYVLRPGDWALLAVSTVLSVGTTCLDRWVLR